MDDSSVFKVAIIGNASVGKTSIITTLMKGEFVKEIKSTIGAAFVSKIFKTKYGTADLHIWDTAGQERFRSVVPMYLRNVDAAIVVFAVDAKESFDQLNEWIEILESASTGAPIYIVANKIDLGKGDLFTKGENFAKENNYKFFGTSALDKDSISELFEVIANDCALYKVEECNRDEVEIDLAITSVEKKKECC